MHTNDFIFNIKNHHKKIALIPSTENTSEIEHLYKFVTNKHSTKEIHILQPQPVVCPLKMPKYDFYIIRSRVCESHGECLQELLDDFDVQGERGDIKEYTDDCCNSISNTKEDKKNNKMDEYFNRLVQDEDTGDEKESNEDFIDNRLDERKDKEDENCIKLYQDEDLNNESEYLQNKNIENQLEKYDLKKHENDLSNIIVKSENEKCNNKMPTKFDNSECSLKEFNLDKKNDRINDVINLDKKYDRINEEKETKNNDINNTIGANKDTKCLINANSPVDFDNMIKLEYKQHQRFTDTTFLIKRLSKIEQIKSKTSFGIFFTHKSYLNLARKIKSFLITNNKLAYFIYLQDLSYERLTCIDNIEAIVIIDCPDFIPFDLELLVPLVTPFDVLLAFDKEYKWNGEYVPNYFDVTSDQRIVKVENSLAVLNFMVERNVMVSVEFESVNEDLDTEVKKGRSGIASQYINEGVQ